MEKAAPANNYHYNKALQAYARENRKKMTKAAAALWSYLLRAGNLKGYPFRRERPILNYIVDFVCLPLLLVIEVDGVTHEWEDAQVRDRQKDAELTAVGFTVLRFTNGEVLYHMDLVAEEIVRCIKELEQGRVDEKE